MKKYLIFSLVGIILLGGLGILLAIQTSKPSAPPDDTNDENSISIITTLYPLYDITSQIASNTADIALLVDPGTEPHSFEPSTADIVRVNEADIFIYNGKDMEPWANDLIAGLSSEVIIVDVSQGIDLQSSPEDLTQGHNHSTEDHHDHGHNHNDTSLDPHFWLDFDNTKIMTRTITQVLINTNPDQSDLYQKNKDYYIEELTSLDQAYASSLGQCSNKTLVHAGHYAFGYLANRYNIVYRSAQSISPNSEPSPRDLAQLVEIINKENVSTVFVEYMIEPRIGRILSQETGTSIQALNPGHLLSPEEFESKISFIQIMRQNLDALLQGFGC